MTPADAGFLTAFLARTGMYICPVDEHGIIAFIDGYEAGRAGGCGFTDHLAKTMAEKHKVKPDSLGWPSQTRRFAARCGISWTEAFLLNAGLVLTQCLIGQEDPP